MDYYEVDFKGFGYRELAEASELLKEIGDNGISDSLALSMPVKIGFNANSGNVFLTDDDYNVAMFKDGKLEDFITCPECGHEDFKSGFTKGEAEHQIFCTECKKEI